METSSFKPRRPWLAGVLSLLGGPLGQIYVGRLRRSLLLWFVGVCLSLLLGLSFISLPIGRFGLLVLCLYVVVFPVYLAADAFLLARRNRHALPKRYQRWWVYPLFFILFSLSSSAVAHFMRSYLTEAFVVPTRSMSPTIQPGDRVLVDKLWFNRTHIHRGNVVVFRSKGPDFSMFLRRVAGLPGDELEIENERVFVNGTEWDDPHAVFNGPLPPYDVMVNYRRIKIPPGYCFLLGDNRRRSKDSRMEGPTPISDVYGIARCIYWSRERTFPNAGDTTHFVMGRIQWERVGLRLD